jgi:hypothetical protein
MGRPTVFDPVIAAEIIRRLPFESIRSICATEGFPSMSTVFSWAANTKEHAEFAGTYAHARMEQCEVLADDIITLADDKSEDPNSRRVRIDARKWLLSKLRPDKYGDRLAVDARVEHSAGAEILAALRQRRGAEQAEPAAIEAAIQRED